MPSLYTCPYKVRISIVLSPNKFFFTGGTFALYSLISRYTKVSLIPNQQAEDELVSRLNNPEKPSATLRRASWLKNLLETSKAVKISLFFLTILAIAMVISDSVLTPPISGTT
jgi:KUP system potassium uptake protein